MSGDDKNGGAGNRIGEFLRLVIDGPSQYLATGSSFGPIYERPRATPKGTVVIEQKPDTVTLEVKAAIRTWWVVPYAMLPLVLVGSLPLGIFFGTYFNPTPLGYSDRWQSFFMASVIWIPILLLAINLLLFRWTKPWVRIVADRQFIKVGQQFFDRKVYGGMQLGYQIETTGGVLKNDFHDIMAGLQGIRVQYGPWGQDLPYLVSGYHASEIILWLNYMIGATEPPKTAPIAESGHRPQTFT